VSTQLFDQENYEVATAIAEVDSKQLAPNDPMAIIAMAVQSGAEPGQLRELLELQREWAKDRAAEAFAQALTQFQRQCKFVTKTRDAKIRSNKGEGSSYSYKFAGFDDVMRQAGPALDDCGLAVSFSTQAIDKGIRVTCRIRHGIHSEDHTLDVPVPQMNVNDTQRYGAALSYAKRYALCAALNIIVTDDKDDDGEGCYETVTEEQAIQIREWVESKSVNLKRFLEWAEAESIEKIPAEKYQPAIDYLKRK
jgi:hypothetical protein